MPGISNQLSARALSYHSRVMQKGEFYILKGKKIFSVHDLCLHSMYFWQEAFYAGEEVKKAAVEEAVLW